MNGQALEFTKGHENPGYDPVCQRVCQPPCHPEFISGSQALQDQEILKQVQDDREAELQGGGMTRGVTGWAL